MLYSDCCNYSNFLFSEGLGFTDALCTISHHLHESLNAGIESYIIQLDLSATFVRVSHSGPLLGRVDGATSEWISIVSGAPQGSVLGPLIFLLHGSKMFELIENRLYAYAANSTLLAVVRKPADRPAVAASRNRDLVIVFMSIATPGGWYWIISRSRTVNPSNDDLAFTGVSIRASLNRDILDVKFHRKLTFEDHVHGIVSVSLRELVFWGWWNQYLWTSLCHFVAIWHLFSQSLRIVLRCGVSNCMSPSDSWAPGVFGGQTFVLMSARCIWWPDVCLDESFLSLCLRRRVAWLGM